MGCSLQPEQEMVSHNPMDCKTTRQLCLWGVSRQECGRHALLQGTFPAQGSNPHLLLSPALAGGFFTTSTTWEAQLATWVSGNKGDTSPCGSAGKESACSAGDLGSIPGLGRCPGEGKGCPLQYPGLENPMVCIVHGVEESRTRLSGFHFLACSLSPTPGMSLSTSYIFCGSLLRASEDTALHSSHPEGPRHSVKTQPCSHPIQKAPTTELRSFRPLSRGSFPH